MTHPPDDRPDHPTSRAVPSKATLFCPDCGHRSRVDGDWTVVETARAVHYVCPDCRGEIAARPTDIGRSRTRSTAVWAAWGAGLRAWGRLWYRAMLPARTDG